MADCKPANTFLEAETVSPTRRFLVVATCILVSPIYLSEVPGERGTTPMPYAVTALAGHVTGGTKYCACGPEDCVCDPGEDPNLNGAVTGRRQATAGDASPTGNAPGFVLMALTILWIVYRLRA